MSLVALALARPVDAQLFPPSPAVPDTGGVGFHAVGLVTEARPGLAGASKREFYLTQPMMVIHDPREHFSGHMMLNFEAWTLEEGELNAGTWGEGFVDRRHPHTVLHEVVLTGQTGTGSIAGSATAGRGFVPFGSDDPMARPFVKYPINHHLSQVLERWVAIGALGFGRLVIEGAAFNGDEPDGPKSTGQRSRFGDSFAGRVTLWPWDALELEASRALIESPEHIEGAGLDHRKWHASARYQSRLGGLPVYALYEWAQTDEYDDDVKAFSFASTLFETSVGIKSGLLALRWERTTRPEEERLEDPFRSARPQQDATLLGVTRWSGFALHAAYEGGTESLRLMPFVEVGRLTAEEITGALFDPAAFYGSDVHWTLSAGMRVMAGVRQLRVGRYGVALRGESHAMGGHE